MANIYEELRLLTEGLEDGETSRGDCISCGRSGTFTLTRLPDGGVYNCYSASCDFSGFVPLHGGALLRSKTPRPKQTNGNPYTGEIGELDDEKRAVLRNRFSFEEYHFDKSGVRYAPVDDRYAFPIYAATGKRVGWIMRHYDSERTSPKSLTYRDVPDARLQSWYRGEGRDCIVVEDIPSAVRACPYFGVSVAMNSGNVGWDVIREIKSYCPDVVWAFDADNTNNAIRNNSKFGFWFDSSKVLVLNKDIKNMTEEELKHVVSKS